MSNNSQVNPDIERHKYQKQHLGILRQQTQVNFGDLYSASQRANATLNSINNNWLRSEAGIYAMNHPNTGNNNVPDPTPNNPNNNNNNGNKNGNSSSSSSSNTQKVKIATSNLFISGEADTLPQEAILAQEAFVDIGGFELLEIVRTDSVSGVQQQYLPVTGLADLNMQYDPSRIIALQDTDEKYFEQFQIPIDKYVPLEGNGPNGEVVFIDMNKNSPTYRDLIINTTGITTERVEIEFLTFENILDDTIIET